MSKVIYRPSTGSSLVRFDGNPAVRFAHEEIFPCPHQTTSTWSVGRIAVGIGRCVYPLFSPFFSSSFVRLFHLNLYRAPHVVQEWLKGLPFF
jgi:hypothetical protein